jgi:hypothetical protein
MCLARGQTVDARSNRFRSPVLVSNTVGIASFTQEPTKGRNRPQKQDPHDDWIGNLRRKKIECIFCRGKQHGTMRKASTSSYRQYRARQTGGTGPPQLDRRIGDVALLVHLKAIFNEMKVAHGWRVSGGSFRRVAFILAKRACES